MRSSALLLSLEPSWRGSECRKPEGQTAGCEGKMLFWGGTDASLGTEVFCSKEQSRVTSLLRTLLLGLLIWVKDFQDYSLIETFSTEEMDLSAYLRYGYNAISVYADVFTTVIN